MSQDKEEKKATYTLSQDGNESDYESKEGTQFKPEKEVLGKGEFSLARKIRDRLSGKTKVVLQPSSKDASADINYDELRKKEEFFNALYPNQDVELFKFKETYRLVVPFIEGFPYDEIPDRFSFSRIEQLELCLSAIDALAECHKKGYVVIDLHAGNIYYDTKNKKSHLLDGGESVKIGEASCFPALIATGYNSNYRQYAPECFEGAFVASEKVDVYALAILFKDLGYPEEWFLSCLERDPSKRPTLSELREAVVVLQDGYKENLKQRDAIAPDTIMLVPEKAYLGLTLESEGSGKSEKNTDHSSSPRFKSNFLLAVFCHPALMLLGYVIILLGKLAKTIPEKGMGSPKIMDDAFAVGRTLFDLKALVQDEATETPAKEETPKPTR